MLAVKGIKAVYDEAGWIYGQDEFSSDELRKVHSIELNNDLVVNFQVIYKNQLLVTSPIFELKGDESQDGEKIRKASQLLVSVNAEHSLSSSVVDKTYFLELLINTENLSEEQVLYLVQNFMDDCDIFIAKIKELDEALSLYYSKIPLEFMIN